MFHQAYCQHLENQVDDLKQKVDELTAELKMTKSQLVQARVQQEALVSALRTERSLRKKKSAGSSRNSADIDELLEKSEKMANVDGLRGKIYQLLPRSRSNSRSKMAALNGNETVEDNSCWNGAVEIAEHSSGADRMRSSNLIRRLSQEKQNPRTSTPVASSGGDSPGYLDESQVAEIKKDSKESESTQGQNEQALNSTDVALAEPEDTKKDKNCHRGASCGRQPRTHSSKRDSEISVDTSPTPST